MNKFFSLPLYLLVIFSSAFSQNKEANKLIISKGQMPNEAYGYSNPL